MPNHQAVRIDVVSDVVCPWCFIGKRRLEKAIALNPDIPVEVHYRPYFLNDWIPREGISREEYLTTKFGSPERYNGIAQRVRAADASLIEYITLDNVGNGFPERPRAPQPDAAFVADLQAQHAAAKEAAA